MVNDGLVWNRILSSIFCMGRTSNATLLSQSFGLHQIMRHKPCILPSTPAPTLIQEPSKTKCLIHRHIKSPSLSRFSLFNPALILLPLSNGYSIQTFTTSTPQPRPHHRLHQPLLINMPPQITPKVSTSALILPLQIQSHLPPPPPLPQLILHSRKEIVAQDRRLAMHDRTDIHLAQSPHLPQRKVPRRLNTG